VGRNGPRPTSPTHVAEVAPLVAACIIKDCVIIDGVPDVMVTPGEGLVDFGAVLSALMAAGFDGPFYLECVAGTTLDEIHRNVCRSLDFVRDTLP
jgi:sugar phosphate isomerase/epimerase